MEILNKLMKTPSVDETPIQARFSSCSHKSDRVAMASKILNYENAVCDEAFIITRGIIRSSHAYSDKLL